MSDPTRCYHGYHGVSSERRIGDDPSLRKVVLHTLHAAGCLIGARLTHNWRPFSFVCVLFGAEPFDGLVANVVLLSGGLGRRGR